MGDRQAPAAGAAAAPLGDDEPAAAEHCPECGSPAEADFYDAAELV